MILLFALPYVISLLSSRVRRSLWRLETMVPTATIMEITPAQETGTPNWTYMDGHAAPRRASGRPRLIKER